MHVAINGWFWDQQATGSGQYLRHLVPNLKKVSPDLGLSLILPPHIQEPDDVPASVNVINARSFGHAPHALGIPPARRGRRRGNRGRLAKVFFEQRSFPRAASEVGADLAHVPYWGPPLSCPVKLISTVLDVIPLQFPVYNRGLLTSLYTSLVSVAARGSNHIITISETAKLDIEEYLGIPEDKISVAYLSHDAGFHPRLGSERDAAVREKYDLPERFVLYLGGFDWRKQVNMLLLSYTYVAEADGDAFPLVIAGREPAWNDQLFPDMRAYSSKLGIDDYVRWIGFVDEEDKPSLYRLADVFAFPSIYEGFGLMALEALASGTPVVTSKALVFEEVLEDAVYMVDNAREMAGAIIALLIQQPLRETMVNQGLALASKYSWRKTAQETLAVYEAVLHS
ncbi:MAG: glycosyltransferase family 1 protein [Chloroflexi bacterium]|nr:glycosyltransferase family 1 protein [Chloroflexota bacterium]